MTLGSLFDGIGGFPLVAKWCDIETLWTSDIEPAPCRISHRHFPNALQLGDVTKINGAKIPPVDIITFGSPCQDLSVANKERTGLAGERSGLFMEAIRIIKEMRKETNGRYPTFAVWENVYGAFSSNHGEDFRTVIEEFIRIKEPNAVIDGQKKWNGAGLILGNGYSFGWRTFQACYWGVPQRRRRIYACMDFTDRRCAEKILFECESLRRDVITVETPWERSARIAKESN